MTSEPVICKECGGLLSAVTFTHACPSTKSQSMRDGEWLKLVDGLSQSEARAFQNRITAEDRKLRSFGGDGNNKAVSIRKSFEGPGRTEYAVWVIRTYTL